MAPGPRPSAPHERPHCSPLGGPAQPAPTSCPGTTQPSCGLRVRGWVSGGRGGGAGSGAPLRPGRVTEGRGARLVPRRAGRGGRRLPRGASELMPGPREAEGPAGPAVGGLLWGAVPGQAQGASCGGGGSAIRLRWKGGRPCSSGGPTHRGSDLQARPGRGQDGALAPGHPGCADGGVFIRSHAWGHTTSSWMHMSWGCGACACPITHECVCARACKSAGQQGSRALSERLCVPERLARAQPLGGRPGLLRPSLGLRPPSGLSQGLHERPAAAAGVFPFSTARPAVGVGGSPMRQPRGLWGDTAAGKGRARLAEAARRAVALGAGSGGFGCASGKCSQSFAL